MDEDVPEGQALLPFQQDNHGPILPDANDWEQRSSSIINFIEEATHQSDSNDMEVQDLSHAPSEDSTGEVSYGDELMTDWGRLPHVVLSVIFSKLKDKDRIKASQVCKHWKFSVDNPSLWRTRNLRFTGSCVTGNYSQNVLGFARKYGQHLHRLSIQCMHPTYSVAKKFQSCMTSFLHALNTKRANNRRCELRELTVHQIHVERYWRYESIRGRLVSAFCRFLRKQYKLDYCDLSEMTISAQDGLRVLEALGDGAGRRLSTLNIEDFFAARLAIFAVPRFRLVLSVFHNLQVLITNYNYLSDDLVHLLTANCARKLKCLSVKVYRLDPCRHEIHPHTWSLLRRACPKLRVCLYFEAIGAYTDLVRIACREIPLKVIQIWTGMNYHEEYWRLGETIRYLGRTFSKTLEEACFYLENPREEIDDALLSFLGRSRHLEVLDVQAVLTVPTIATICDWQEKYKIALQKCHVALDNLTGIEVDELDAIVDKYRDMLDERGHDFQLLANPGF